MTRPSPIIDLSEYVTIPSQAKADFLRLQAEISRMAPAFIGAATVASKQSALTGLMKVEELARSVRRGMRQ